jgi:hypothetical protein
MFSSLLSRRPTSIERRAKCNGLSSNIWLDTAETVPHQAFEQLRGPYQAVTMIFLGSLLTSYQPRQLVHHDYETLAR